MVDVPVGLIHSSRGGTPPEAWTSRAYLKSSGDLYSDQFRQWEEAIAAFPEKNAAHPEKVKKWEVIRDSLCKADQKVPSRPNALLGPNHPHRPVGLYAIWYQGEANCDRAHQYRTLFPLMIENWREAWGQVDFPFYWVYLQISGL
jgi:sialate O-acetylesterase